MGGYARPVLRASFSLQSYPEFFADVSSERAFAVEVAFIGAGKHALLWMFLETHDFAACAIGPCLT